MSQDSALEELLSSGFPGDEGSRGFPGDEASQGAMPHRREEPHRDGRKPRPQVPGAVHGGGALHCALRRLRGRVSDRVILLAAGRVWHGACLRCSLCQCELQSHASLYCRDGKIYCQHDYCRLFSVGRCARCSQPIPSSALVMRSGALTFHPHCFSCQECDVTLLPGNLYCARGRSLYCQSHYQADGRARPPGPDQLRQTDREVGTGEGRSQSAALSPDWRMEQQGQGSGRTKRIRTCFRSEQLRAMESYFALKHNPDGKDWTCLSHRTGLPKRVLQVWFQNARAKLRRSLPADDSQSNSPAAMATMPASMATSQPSQALQTSTIDQLELSLLTAPLSDTPQSPIGQPRDIKTLSSWTTIPRVHQGSLH